MKKIRLISLLLILTLLCGCAGQRPTVTEADILTQVHYPEQAPYPDESVYSYEDGSLDTAYAAWRQQETARQQNYEYIDGKLDDFINTTVPAVLGDCEDNTAYSPLNLYMALSMLAQTADGESQAQILQLLSAQSTDELATLANRLFHAHYQNDGSGAVIPANALFLRNDLTYKKEVLQKLGENYYAAVLQGEMGTDTYDMQLQNWISEQTDGLLQSNIQTRKDHIMVLISTLYFSSNWSKKFAETNNTVDTFYAKAGNTQATYMHRESEMTYYADDTYGAVQCSLDHGDMWFILPDKGVDVNELVQNGAVSAILHPAENKTYYHKVNLSVPKFDLVSTLELSDTLKELGMSDVFDSSKAHFSNLTDGEAYLSQVSHNVRVTIDEEGCTAAAYTAMALCGAAAPSEDEPIDFTLDRPFIFVITAQSGTPLFVGVVQDPS